jgi:alkylation response protein AidB-like acyl-CoA dehydrogenase
MYCGAITGAMHIIALFGSEEVKKMYLPKMMSGEWGGTMCLTESVCRFRRRSAQI